MVHIITNSGWNMLSSGNKMLLSCIPDCGKIKKANFSDIYNPNKIAQQIELSAKAKQQLDADIFERSKRISQCIEASKNIK